MEGDTIALSLLSPTLAMALESLSLVFALVLALAMALPLTISDTSGDTAVDTVLVG